jgi:uncharacterized membrane protein|tara:strand:+ start:351 stop:824 length:474 start_codon:yes stop_codon:yes gene_type:complete
MNDIYQIMQVAVTPVFLLAGIGSLIISMISRLGRIKDRMRVLQRAYIELNGAEGNLVLEESRLRLILRSKFCYAAICLSAVSGLFVCCIILTLFVEGLYQLSISSYIAMLFISSMIFLIFALIFFVIEVFIATRSIHKKMDDTESVLASLSSRKDSE